MEVSNREIATRMVETMAKGELDDELLTDDVHWWVPGTGTLNREQFTVIMTRFNAIRAGVGTMTIVGVTADGDRVAVEAKAEIPLKNGSVYANTYHFLFQFREGKICLAKEYNDSARAAAQIADLLIS